jgi:hypothetical protein
MTSELSRAERAGWAVAMVLIVAFAIPWFLWGNDRLLLGLPIWLWWHIGWLLLAATLFNLFTHRAWGIGVAENLRPEGSDGDQS